MGGTGTQGTSREREALEHRGTSREREELEHRGTSKEQEELRGRAVSLTVQTKFISRREEDVKD